MSADRPIEIRIRAPQYIHTLYAAAARRRGLPLSAYILSVVSAELLRLGELGDSTVPTHSPEPVDERGPPPKGWPSWEEYDTIMADWKDDAVPLTHATMELSSPPYDPNELVSINGQVATRAKWLERGWSDEDIAVEREDD